MLRAATAGLLVLIWATVWYLLVYDTPDSHPRIKEEERKYIEMKLAGCLNKEKHLPPYKQIFSSPAFYSLIFLHFGNCWGLWLMVTTGPKYLSEVLGLQLSGVGGLATLPHLARVVCAFGFGAVADVIRKRGWMSVTTMRKFFVIFSHLIPGILILIQPEMGCNITLAILLLTLSLGMNGACTVTNIQNSHDLAPNFAGSLYGIINCIGTTTGFITPMLAGYFTQNDNGLAEWRKVFTIGAIIYITSGVVFCIFGSGEIQSWNEIHTSDEAKPDKGQDNPAFEQTETVQDNGDAILENTKV